MLEAAIPTLDKKRPMLYSEQEWQYRHRSYQQRLKQAGIEQSMSRRGNCLDDAMAENFFGHFKQELIENAQFRNIAKLKNQVADYLDWHSH